MHAVCVCVCVCGVCMRLYQLMCAYLGQKERTPLLEGMFTLLLEVVINSTFIKEIDFLYLLKLV